MKIVELEGLAPSVFVGMYFADMGHSVTLVTREQPPVLAIPVSTNLLNRNKTILPLSIKSLAGHAQLLSLLTEADILIDPYRPNVLEKLNLSPEYLHSINPKLIIVRITGYGQTGSDKSRPGHDLNYIAGSGMLSLLNSNNKLPQFPANYTADFVTASLAIIGTLVALSKGLKEVVVDCSLTHGSAYLAQLAQLAEQEQRTLHMKHMNHMNHMEHMETHHHTPNSVPSEQLPLTIPNPLRPKL